MNDIRTSKEINLLDLLYKCLLKWRRVLVFSILVSLIVGALHLVTYLTLSTEKYDIEKQSYETKVESHNTSITVLENQIASTRDEIERQNAYNQNSLLMQINPSTEALGSVEYYIDTKYEILLDKTYQNIDYSGRVLGAYNSFFRSGGLTKLLIEKLGYEIESRYLDELISISYDYSNMIFTIWVKRNTETECAEMLQTIEDFVETQKETIDDTVYEHTLIKLNEKIDTVIDSDLNTYQRQKHEAIDSLNQVIIAASESLEKLEKTSEPEFKYDLVIYFKSSITNVVIAFFVSAITYFIYSAIRYILSKKLHEPQDLYYYLGLNVICTIHNNTKSRVDKFIMKIFSKAASDTRMESNARLLLKKVELLVDTSKAQTEVKNIMIITSMKKKEEAVSICNQLNKEASNKSFHFVAGGSVTEDIDVVEGLKVIDSVILLEKCEVSSVSGVEEEVRLLNSYRKKVLGYVVLE